MTDLRSRIERNPELMETQASIALYYKKKQLSQEVQERRDARIFQLQSEVREARAIEDAAREVRAKRKSAASSAAAAAVRNEEILSEADDFIDLVSPPKNTPVHTPPKQPTPPKRQRHSPVHTSHITPNGCVVKRFIPDTPLLRLIEKLLREHNGNNPALYPPPCCDNDRCGYSTGCLHGQRLALAKRLVELECVLFGKNPSALNGYI